MDTTTLSVSWVEPENHGPPIHDYDIRYRRVGGPWSDYPFGGRTVGGPWKDYPFGGIATTTDIAVQNVSYGYKFRIRATNDEGTSEWSESNSILAQPEFHPGNHDGVQVQIDEDDRRRYLLGNLHAYLMSDGEQSEPLTFGIIGEDAAGFEIRNDGPDGHFDVYALHPWDYETKSSYAITVTVSDGIDPYGNLDEEIDDTMEVTVTVTDVDEP
ncbi:MAG: hypothetical protein F4091_09140 [Acidimicrobiales bacterium]|nr:hypothetical protein [Acidimicrobiales bacterium]